MIGKITTVSTSAQVAYLKTEYLAKGADAEKQEFLGKGAAALGLGIQTTQAINHLCEGRDPATGRLLVESGRNGQRRAGYEFALSPDKTVSLAYAFGDSDTQRAIKGCHDAAVARAVAEVERLTDTRRTENGKREREPVAGIVVAKFDHYASREGEPQLHSHCLLFNLATGRDGALAAITTERLMASKEIVGQIYQMALFEELAAKGIAAEKRETHPSETSREVFTAAVIPALELYALEYSTRRVQIVAAVKREGSAVAAQAAALKTRKAKNEPPLAELKTQWKESAPLTENEIRAAILGKAILTKEKQPTVDDLIKRLVEKTATEKSVLTEADIGKHIAKNLAKHITADEIQTATEKAMESPLLISGGKGPEGQRRFVSTAVLKMEAAMMSKMDEMTDGKFSVSITKQVAIPVVQQAAKNGIVFSKEQTGAISHILTGGRLVTVEGAAGTGKTTIMKAVADIYTAAGCEVIGCSKAAAPAKKLGDDAGIKSGTIDKLNQTLDSGKRRLTNKSVVIIDEAGMLDTTPAAKLIAHAHAAGAKVIMVGDRKQLQPIGQGGAFTHAATLGKGAS
jgi:conjugative relaxase-like TrwC/TraI family protein